MDIKKYFKKHLLKEIEQYYFKKAPNNYVDKLIDDWLNDSYHKSSINRLKIIKKYNLKSHKILDMAGGCGTFYFHGLINKYDMYAIEPENWKLNLVKLKIDKNDYPENWINNFKKGLGEKLPFQNNYFDFISSYQTLEHVIDIKKCLEEMLRVLKINGYIHIKCPDYKSTYEGHYKLPWFYSFSKFTLLAKMYLKFLNRPTAGIKTFNYITKKKIINILKNNIEHNISITDLQEEKFIKKYKVKNLYFIYRFTKKIKILFKQESTVDLIVKKLN